MLRKACQQCVRIANGHVNVCFPQDLRRSRPPLVGSSRSFRNCLRARAMRHRFCSSTGLGTPPGAGTNSFSIILPPTATRPTRSVFAHMAEATVELGSIAAVFAIMWRISRPLRPPYQKVPFWSAIPWVALSSRSFLRRARLRRRSCSQASRQMGHGRRMRGSCAVSRSTHSGRMRPSVFCRLYRTLIARGGSFSPPLCRGMTLSATIASCRTSRCSAPSTAWRSNGWP